MSARGPPSAVVCHRHSVGGCVGNGVDILAHAEHIKACMFCMYGYNHNVIPVCPACGPSRFVPVPVRIVARLVWR